MSSFVSPSWFLFVRDARNLRESATQTSVNSEPRTQHLQPSACRPAALSQSSADDLLCLFHYGVEMGLTLKALRIQFVNIFCPGWPGCKPSFFRDDLETADRTIVARSTGQLGENRITGHHCCSHGIRREFTQPLLLVQGGRRIDPHVVGCAELGREFTVLFAGILAGAGSNFRRKKAEQQAIFIRGPYCSIFSEKAGASALFTSKTAGAVQQAWSKPFKTHGNFREGATKVLHDAINQAAAHNGLPYPG